MATNNPLYLYSVRVLLNALTHSLVDLALRDRVPTLCLLKQFLQKQGLKIRVLTYLLLRTDTTLSNDQYKELQALNSYFNWLQNRYDLKIKHKFDITTVTRQHFSTSSVTHLIPIISWVWCSSGCRILTTTLHEPYEESARPPSWSNHPHKTMQT